MKDFSLTMASPTGPSGVEQPRLPIDATKHPDFYLCHFPMNWECVETDKGPEWLPQLTHFYIKAGVNGVNGKLNSGASRTALADSGAVVIPRDFLPAEVKALDALPNIPGDSYVVKVLARRGWAHFDRWDTPIQLGNGVTTDTNNAQQWAFRRALIEHRLVHAPDRRVLEMLMERKRNRYSRNIKNAHLAEAKREADKAMAELEMMQKAAISGGYAGQLTMANTKAEIQERLDALGISFAATASKAQLLELMNAQGAA